MSESTVSWAAAAADARAALSAEWNPATTGTRSVVRAVRALLDRLEEHARTWEEQGWPDIDAPADATVALRAIQSDSDARRARALELFGEGDQQGAIAELRAAVQQLVHPDVIPTLALTYRKTGRFDEARQSMRAAVAIRPDDDARRRTLATYDGAQPPEEGQNVTADWIDPERRPKPTPDFMMDSR